MKDNLKYKVTTPGSEVALLGNNYTGNLVIPSTVTDAGITYGVTGIERSAFFSEFGGIESLSIPASVTAIKPGTFAYVENLTTITTDGTHFTFEDGVLFDYGKTKLIRYLQKNTATTYTVPPTVTAIDDYGFANCDNLNSITLPATMESIGNFAFWYAKISSITLPSGITTIGEETFRGSNITAVVIPEGVLNIGEKAFDGCSNLEYVELPSTITGIEDNAFNQFSGPLSHIKVKMATPPTISSSAFSYVDKNTCLLEVPVGTKTTYKNTDVWKDFNVTLETGEPLPVGAAFVEPVSGIRYQITSLAPAPSPAPAIPAAQRSKNGTADATNQVAVIKGDNSKTANVIPPTVTNSGVTYDVTKIKNNSFNALFNISSISVPASVTEIEENAFFNATGLTAITVDTENPAYSAEDGVLFDKLKTNLIVYPLSKPGISYSIPDGVTTISKNAFYYNNTLNSLYIPPTVNSYGNNSLNFQSLETLSVNRSTPSSIFESDYVFLNSMYSACTLEVPQGSLQAYQDAEVWKEFNTKVEKVFTGTAALDKEGLDIYPNPFVNEINIQGTEQATRVTLIDLTGKTVLDKSVQNLPVRLNVSKVPQGVYLLSISLENGDRAVRKVVKR